MSKPNALRWIITEAKSLRRKHPKRFDTWREYVAQASAIYASKHKGKSPVGKKRKVGAVKFIEKKETKRTKPRTIRVQRKKDGTFKSFKQVGAIDNYRFFQNQRYLKRLADLNNELKSEASSMNHLRDSMKSYSKPQRTIAKRQIEQRKRSMRNLMRQISMTKSLIK